MKLTELDYYLPKELIAQMPVKPRDHNKLLILNRSTGSIKHRRFYNIIDYFNQGDILVLNNTRVIPCRLIAQRKSGGIVDILLYQQDQKDKSFWTALINFNRRLGEKEELILSEDNTIRIQLWKRLKDGWLIKTNPIIDVQKLQDIGKMPLPPYIKRAKASDTYLKSDKNDYQTVYADKDGSIAAPTAGLHFTDRLIAKLVDKGIRIVYVTLHIGPGTFKSIRIENIEKHQMEKEYFEVGMETMRVLSEAYRDKKRVIAVGTTVCRVLETIADQIKMNMVHPLLEKQRILRASLTRGWTDLFIYPSYKFKMVNSLITNFHLPHGTPLALVSAFADKQQIMKAYQEAIAQKYRFYSYGDAMFII
ncbi:MAG: tRNA preQ1(34) S-adenosylmethionine ribosyltransferase-isomerase QueA [Planctomycetota bacterium]